MSALRASMVGFDITPRFHSEAGAWGTTPHITDMHMPLLSRCLVLEQDGRVFVWFASDLVGDTVARTGAMRCEVAEALGVSQDQVMWSTSQTHSCGAVPGSTFTGTSFCKTSKEDPAADFSVVEYRRFIDKYIAAGKEAIDTLRPVRVWAGRGYCDNMSYNSRLPMPSGGNKFSRHYNEGLQSGKFFDTTIGMVRFEDLDGKAIGVIFNFCCHPATLIMDHRMSPDYVGTARQYIEDAVGGAPAMFIQGFCGDVHPYHMFGTPEQAERNGAKVGKAAVEALPTLIPVRSEPLLFTNKRAIINCQPMLTREQLEAIRADWQAYIDSLRDDPQNTWFCGVNLPEHFTPEQRIALVQVNMTWMDEALRMVDAGETARTTLEVPMHVLRVGDLAAVISLGENFTETGAKLRRRSPFVHTLVCGDTNGLFSYIATDVEIDRGGSEPERNWRMLAHDGFRMPPAKGSADRIINTGVELLNSLQR